MSKGPEPMKCERCGRATVGYALHDYCARCSRNLCPVCMADGCCGRVPAESGEKTNDEDDKT